MHLNSRRDTRGRRVGWLTAVLGLVLVAPGAPAWENLLEDPGFEDYRLDPRGFYVPTADAGWEEITFGRGSVQFDASSWKAPAEMLRERPLGFTPGTTGCEGTGPEQNTGRLILSQDIVRPDLFGDGDRIYEAWIWLGGGGHDDDSRSEGQDEVGGWEIFWYGDTDTTGWKESGALEHHRMWKDFWGERERFVQVAGFGRVPRGAKGCRVRVWAGTWATPKGPKDYRTEVAIDNAHLAVIDAPNLLVNGDFELDDRAGELKGWRRPASWPFPRNGIEPLRVINVEGENFDHGQLRPFYGGRWAYGYVSYLHGWRKDAFTFGQHVDYDLPEGTPLALTFNWIQGVKEGSKAAQLRLIGTSLEIVVEYLEGEKRLDAHSFWVDWPMPRSAANVCRYDQNEGRPYAPRFRLEPPPGTDRVGVHVNFLVHTPYKDGWTLMSAAVDDFLLVPAERPGSRAAR